MSKDCGDFMICDGLPGNQICVCNDSFIDREDRSCGECLRVQPQSLHLLQLKLQRNTQCVVTNAVQCTTMQYSAMHIITLHYTLQYNAVQWNTLHYIHCNTMQYSAIEYIHYTIHYNTMQCNGIHYSIHHNTLP